jgi:TFIIF-interacting CTD phosphatase-like protein
MYVKDLKTFQEKDLKDLVIIDHDFYCYGSQINNRIPVTKFEASCEDEELNNIKDLLV